MKTGIFPTVAGEKITVVKFDEIFGTTPIKNNNIKRMELSRRGRTTKRKKNTKTRSKRRLKPLCHTWTVNDHVPEGQPKERVR